MTESNPIKIFLRDWYLYFMHFVPSWKRELRLGRRKEGLVKYKYSPGLPFDPSHSGGACLPQVYCKSAQEPGEIFFSDDVIFQRSKKGLFQLLVYVPTVDDLKEAKELVSCMKEVCQGMIHLSEVTFLVEQSGKLTATQTDTSSVYYLATGEEFSQSPLCRGRPEPRYYDSLDMQRALGGNRFTLVRPDRFIYGACNNRQDLEKIISDAVAYQQ